MKKKTLIIYEWTKKEWFIYKSLWDSSYHFLKPGVFNFNLHLLFIIFVLPFANSSLLYLFYRLQIVLCYRIETGWIIKFEDGYHVQAKLKT